MPPPVVDVNYLRARLDAVYSALGHGHTQPDVSGLVAALASKLDTVGGTLSGPLAVPDGTVAANGLQFAGQPGTGLSRDANGMNLCHGGTAALRIRFDQVAAAQNVFPQTDANRTSGAATLRWSSVFAVQMRPSGGSAANPGYAFNNAGTTWLTGLYATASLLGLTLNGVSVANFTSSGFLMETQFQKRAFTIATLPAANSVPAGSELRVTPSQKSVYSDGTVWRYLSDDTVVV